MLKVISGKSLDCVVDLASLGASAIFRAFPRSLLKAAAFCTGKDGTSQRFLAVKLLTLSFKASLEAGVGCTGAGTASPSRAAEA